MSGFRHSTTPKVPVSHPFSVLDVHVRDTGGCSIWGLAHLGLFFEHEKHEYSSESELNYRLVTILISFWFVLPEFPFHTETFPEFLTSLSNILQILLDSAFPFFCLKKNPENHLLGNNFLKFTNMQDMSIKIFRHKTEPPFHGRPEVATH